MIAPRQGGAAYEQLAELLAQLITSGEVTPGARLPSERDLMQTYGLSRQTVRRAVERVRLLGLAELRRGYGVVVREQAERAEWSVPRYARIELRMPTTAEREEHEIAEGVPVADVTVGARTYLIIGDRQVMIVK